MRAFILVVVGILFAGCIVEGPSTTTVPASKKPPASQEMYYEAAQCENPWTGHGDTPADGGTAAEGEQIRSYYDEQGVTMGEVRFENVYEATCAACGCPRGDWAVSSIVGEDIDKARSLGWQTYTGPPT
ncbi:MAG TPA: hypothetical protein VGB18_09720 [Candidatus Thermoplasmatota archaeon]